tara:strand:- start:975 stop:1244 length:270 start_codon:yes stop_codon:yes gene_type:complete
MCDGEPVLSTEHVTHLCGGWKPSDAEINALPGAPFTATESVIISIAWQGVRLSPESVLPALEFLIAREKERVNPHSGCAGQGLFGEKSA